MIRLIKKRSWLPIFYFIAAVCLLILFVKARPVNPESHNRLAGDFRELQTLDAELGEAVLQIHYRLINNYDTVVAIMKRMRALSGSILQLELAGKLPDAPEFINEIGMLQQQIAQKEIALEQFKSSNSVIKNSFIYLPRTVNVTLARLPKSDVIQREIFALLLRDALLISINSTDYTNSALEQDIKAVDQTVPQLPEEIKGSAKLAARHAKLIFKNVRDINDLLLRLRPIGKNNVGTSLEELYQAHYRAQQGTAARYQILLFLAAISMLGYAAFSYYRMIEKGRQLTHALAGIRNQQFALDEHAIVCIADVKGEILYVNQKFEDISGYFRDELLGQDHRMINASYHSPDYFSELLLAVEKGNVWHGQIMNRAKNGNFFWLEATIVPFMDEAGKLYQYVSIYTDITDQKLMEEQVEASRRLLQNVMDTLGEGVYTLDVHGCCTYLNREAERMLGWSSQELLGKNFHEIIHSLLPDGTQVSLTECMMHQSMDAGQTFRSDNDHFQRKDGTLFPISIVASPIWDGQKVIGSVAAFQDISDRKLVEQEQRIAAIAFESQEGILITDRNRCILRVNHAFINLTGYTAEEAIGKTPAMLQSGQQDPEFFTGMWDVLTLEKYWQGEVWYKRKNGEIFPAWLTVTAVTDASGDVTHYISVFADITLRKKAEEQIHQLAFYDPLTNLPNRRLLIDRLNHAMASGLRRVDYAALLFIDMDNFKTLNDTRGHDVGDLLLIEASHRLLDCVRGGDTVARLGGDEFVVMMGGLSKDLEHAATQAKAVGEKIREALSRTYQLRSFEYHSSCSIGISLFRANDVSVDDLLKRADTAMYEAKNSGRNALRFFDPVMRAVLESRVRLESDLREAILLNQFVIFCQTQVNATNKTVGAEALVRWQHPERGLVMPNEFIPLSEEIGLILPIGLWVLETACIQIKSWEAHPSTSELQLAVNVSARQFYQPEFVDQVRGILERTGAKPDRLKLELTESVVLDNINDAIAKMHKLKDIGLSFSMDDFGTGYSSLAYLTRLPLDQLKIDQSFVRNIGKSLTDAVIVETIIGMANSLGINVIAEGVETESQRAFLEDAGCMSYQGFLFGHPIPLEEIANLVMGSDSLNVKVNPERS